MDNQNEHISDSSSFSPTTQTRPPRSPAPLNPEEQSLIQQQYNELIAQNELLAKENRLFDSFLQSLRIRNLR